MSLPQIVVLVLGILAVQAIAWVAILRWAKRRSAQRRDELTGALQASGERTLRGPEPAVYRGGSGEFPRVKGNGLLALTDRRIVFAKLIGPQLELSTRDIADVREEKWFRRSAVGSQVHVVVKTRSGDEIGFFVRDRHAWITELRALAELTPEADGPAIKERA